MRTRMLSFAALLSAYALIALSVAKDPSHAALFLAPILLMCLLTLRSRWNLPRTVVLAGLGLLVPVCALGVAWWGPLSLFLVVAQFVVAALFGLYLVESVRADTPESVELAGIGGLVPEEMARSIVSRELRRSRRTGTPVTLLVLKGMAGLEPVERRALGESLRVHGREFDIVFAPSSDELAILCVDTTRSGAREYAERIRSLTRVVDFALACFPTDAVTLQGLFDAVREPVVERGPRPVALPGQFEPERHRDSEVIS